MKRRSHSLLARMDWGRKSKRCLRCGLAKASWVTMAVAMQSETVVQAVMERFRVLQVGKVPELGGEKVSWLTF